MTERLLLIEISQTQVYVECERRRYAIPLYASRVAAGYPSPADEYIERYIDLSPNLVKNPATTFLVIATGDSMTGVGIQSGDMLVVDKQIEAGDGKIVIAAVDGELTVKRLSLTPHLMQLLPEDPPYKPITITPEQHVVIGGVVTYLLTKKDNAFCRLS